MKFAVRNRTHPSLPGVSGPARVDRRSARLLARLRPGDIAVLEHVDMDRATAQALVDAGVVAVVNTGPMISGRYPNLGPQLLVDAGVVLADEAGPQLLDRVKDGTPLRLDGGVVHAGDAVVASARELDADEVRRQMEAARLGLTAQLENFTHNSTEFLRREQDVLLHGHGVPRTKTQLADRPVVVVVASHDWEGELRGAKPFIREQKPVLIGVDRGADALVKAGHRPDVVVVSGDEDAMPRAEVLRKARDVVALAHHGTSGSHLEQLSRLSVRPLPFETGATAEDAALLLAEAGGARLIVGVGMHATLDEFLDRRRPGLASTFLTRLKVGPHLVDASALPALYDGKVRPRHLLGVCLAGLVALGAAIGVTPAGQEWATDLAPHLDDLVHHVQGLFS
jgi:uncharacterized membrane-anchored protein